MADHKFDANAYANEIAANAKGKTPPPPKILNKIGQEGTFFTPPFTVVSNNSGFEMKGKGAIDAQIIGARPQRPEEAIK